MPSDALDPLYTKIARKILTETLHVNGGDSVTVESWDNGLPFARRVLAEARALGCTAVLILEDERAYVEGVKRAPENSVGKMGKNEYGLLSGTDAYIFIPGQALGGYSKTLKPEERERSLRYNSSWYDAAEKAGLKGARLSFGYVGKDLARFLRKSVKEVVRAQLRAALADFGQVATKARMIAPLLTDGTEAELETERSTLTFFLKGEVAVEDGLVDEEDKRTGNNMTYVPPGFVSKEVDPESANGTVVLSDSLTDLGVISRAKLEFKEGRLVAWESADRAKIGELVASIPSERRRLRLLTIGLNPALGYGWGQDRFVEGSLTLGGFGFRGLVRKGTLRVASSRVTAGGRLQV